MIRRWLCAALAVVMLALALPGAFALAEATETAPAAALRTPKIQSVKSEKTRTLTVKCSKVGGADGYEFQVALDAEFTRGVKKASTTGASKVSARLKELKSGRVYYARVRSWKKSGKKKAYSDWSKAKKQRVAIYHDTSVYGSRLPGSYKKKVSRQIDQFIQKNIKAGMTEEDIADAILDFIVVDTPADSDYQTPYKHYENTAWAVLNYKHAACSGFCRLTKAMFDSVDIPCKHVNASQWTHQWNEIKIGGQWYHVDTQLAKFQYLFSRDPERYGF